jgi:hypothetical protein
MEETAGTVSAGRCPEPTTPLSLVFKILSILVQKAANGGINFAPSFDKPAFIAHAAGGLP